MPFSNMTLEELARHIGMDARELRRLAEKGVLPAQLVGGQWRFNRAEVLDWLQREMHTLGDSHVRNLERAMSVARDEAVLERLLRPEAVDMALPARSRNSVLRELVRLAERTGLVYSADDIIEALEQREALYSTALSGGFAFPHPRRPLPYATAEPLVCLARVPAGIPFGAPDGRLTFIFTMVCSHEERDHLQCLARLAAVFQTGVYENLIGLDDAAEALETLLAAERAVLARRR